MSAETASLPCPICLHTGVFDTAQSLKDRLIFVSTNTILCPVCQEEVSGIDKLTIHLFSHVKLISAEKSNQKNDVTEVRDSFQKGKPSSDHPKKKKAPMAKNKATDSISSPVKFVKIYPKLPVIAVNTIPVIEMSAAETSVQKNNLLNKNVKSETVPEKNNKCNVCGLQFIDANILNMHKCLIHNIEDNNHSITRYDCHLCPKNFKMRGSLMVHLRVAHYGFSANNTQENSSEIPKSKTGNNIVKPIDFVRQDGKQWQCDVCRKCFTTKYFLKKHKRLHTGETPYSCTQCNKTFTFQQSYHKHLLYHNDEKPHICNYCGRAFKELSTLHNHQRIHTGEKPFACETCGKCFRQRVSYLVHRRIHTGAMPYKCTACDKSFRYKVSQRTHKCQAQPPGTVVRTIGVLVEKLKQKHTEPIDSPTQNLLDNNINYHEISEANAELVRTGAQISLEDMVSDSFRIISDDINQIPTSNIERLTENSHEKSGINLDDLMDPISVTDKNIPSPSDILQSLNLSNEDQVDINEKSYDSFKPFNDFLY